MSAPDQPIERLNYFNGQRLEAIDFRAEQDYQLRVRRWLNRSLYSPGVVKGLEVEPAYKDPPLPDNVDADKHRVVVQPGLAFDVWGREIILLEAMKVTVQGAPSTTEGLVFGNYLVISYAEERAQPVSDRCAVNLATAPCSGDLAWGAPSRIRAEPRLEMVDTWPSDESGKVVLAQIELAKDCTVKAVNQGVRKYAVPAKPPRVRALSLEGEKDVDHDNPKILHFHIADGYPERVLLYLKAAKFSTLYYTQLGRHVHALAFTLSTQPGIAAHTHQLNELSTGDPIHPDPVKVLADVHRGDPEDYALRMWKPHNARSELTLGQTGLGPFLVIEGLKHSHKIAAGANMSAEAAVPDHTHTLSKSETETFGTSGVTPSANTGAPYEYFTDLRVLLEGKDITDKVVEQLDGGVPNGYWATNRLGNGSDTHRLVDAQFPPVEIDLLKIASDLGPGDHKLEFRPTTGGGQIHYNLYAD